MYTHTQPLSLEELLRKKEAEKAAQARPVFMSKKDREAAALARRAEEAAAQRARVAAMRQNLTGGGQSPRGSQVPTTKLGRPLSNRELSEAARKEERERERELELIKQQYLGAGRERKKAPKAAERFKFVFDWDAKEDTSRDLNPLYQNLHDATLLFGRGFRAGIDRREQRKAAADHETELLRLARERAGLEESVEDRQRGARRAADADRYEGKDMSMDRHWSEKSREEMTERDWRIFREDYNISYKGSHIPMPLRDWGDAGFPDPITKAVARAGYKKPSPIQMAAIPLGLQQRDVIGIAETGSGKTAAFVLPMLVYILGLPPMRGHPEVEAEGPYAVVLAPTRELALQIEEETKALAQYTDFRAVSVVGGQSIEEQGFQLRKGCEIVVATPGRLVDCLARSYAVLNQCNYVVLDEADRMIDMGFEPQVVGVLDAMPSSNLRPLDEEDEEEIGGGGMATNGDGRKKEDSMDIDDTRDGPTSANHGDGATTTHRIYRTTTMFSATMPPAVERLARKYLRRPTVINIGTTGKAADTVTQRVVMLKENEKAGFLEQELESMGEEQRIIVFVNTKRQCDAVARTLDSLGYRSTLLHGGKTQDQREESIKGFREDKYNVLVATDVAGRGIDVPNVALVINYDMPNNIEAYTHRIGRTGRAGRKGAAVTFLTPQVDSPAVSLFEMLLRVCIVWDSD